MVAVALVLGLTSCGSPVEKDATYGTVEELGRAVKNVVEVHCGQGTGNSAENGWHQETCGDRAVIGVFANDATLREVKAKNPTDADSVIVEGPNWIVWAAGGRENEIKEKLGGTIFKAPTPFRGRIELNLTSLSKPGIQKLKPGTTMECNVSPSSLMKDLSGDSKATITTASKLVLTGGIVSGKLDGETTCILTYEIPNIPADVGPLRSNGRIPYGGSCQAKRMARGVGLQLGSK